MFLLIVTLLLPASVVLPIDTGAAAGDFVSEGIGISKSEHNELQLFLQNSGLRLNERINTLIRKFLEFIDNLSQKERPARLQRLLVDSRIGIGKIVELSLTKEPCLVGVLGTLQEISEEAKIFVASHSLDYELACMYRPVLNHCGISLTLDSRLNGIEILYEESEFKSLVESRNELLPVQWVRLFGTSLKNKQWREADLLMKGVLATNPERNIREIAVNELMRFSGQWEWAYKILGEHFNPNLITPSGFSLLAFLIYAGASDEEIERFFEHDLEQDVKDASLCAAEFTKRFNLSAQLQSLGAKKSCLKVDLLSEGKIDYIRLLINSGASLNKVFFLQAIKTPGVNEDFLLQMLERLISSDGGDSSNSKELMTALLKGGMSRCCAVLLKHESVAVDKNSLERAIEGGCSDTVVKSVLKKMVKKITAPSEQSKVLSDGLKIALTKNRNQIAVALLEAGACVDQTSLKRAIECGCSDAVVQHVLEETERRRYPTKKSLSDGFYAALEQNRDDVAAHLLKIGNSFTKRDFRLSLVHAIKEYAQDDVVMQKLAQIKRIFKECELSRLLSTALSEALDKHRKNVVIALLKSGAPVRKDSLKKAIKGGCSDAVVLLVLEKAKEQFADSERAEVFSDALRQAISMGRDVVATELLEAGAPVSKNSLKKSVEGGCSDDIVSLVREKTMEKRKPVKVIIRDFNTAVSMGCDVVATELLETGATVSKNSLKKAIKGGCSDAVVLLVLEKTEENFSGRKLLIVLSDAFDAALTRGRDVIAIELLRAGAPVSKNSLKKAIEYECDDDLILLVIEETMEKFADSERAEALSDALNQALSSGSNRIACELFGKNACINEDSLKCAVEGRCDHSIFEKIIEKSQKIFNSYQALSNGFDAALKCCNDDFATHLLFSGAPVHKKSLEYASHCSQHTKDLIAERLESGEGLSRKRRKI
jgi:hypothetical protein